MNDFAKYIVGFIAGAITAGIGVYIYQEKRLTKEFEEELKNYKESLLTEADIREAEKEEKPFSKEEDIPESVLNAVKEMQGKVQRVEPTGPNESKEIRDDIRSSKNNRTQYNGIAKGDKNAIDISRTDIKGTNEEVSKLPVQITEDEYNENRWGYTQHELYYDEDKMTCFDENGTMVEDYEIMVGKNNLDSMIEIDRRGRYVVNDIYVRNDGCKELYWVQMDNSVE